MLLDFGWFHFLEWAPVLLLLFFLVLVEHESFELHGCFQLLPFDVIGVLSFFTHDVELLKKLVLVFAIESFGHQLSDVFFWMPTLYHIVH